MSDSSNNELLLKLKGIDELSPVLIKAVEAMTEQSARVTEAIEKMSSKTTEAKEHTEGLNTGMLNLAAGIEVAKTAYEAAAKAWEKISEQVEKAIDEAEEAEKAHNKLTGALVSQGLYVEKNVEGLEKYISTLEETKGISGEQTSVLLAQSIQMGLNIEQAKGMEEAARKLAVAQGIDANSAFSLLSASINGQTRGLQKIIPEVKNLTEAQLKSGAAAELVNKSLDAQYKLYEGSYSAALKKTENSVSNVYEAVGKMITQNPIVVKGIQAFGEFAAELATQLDDLATWLRGNSALIEQVGVAVEHTLMIGAAALGVWAVAAVAAAGPTTILVGAIGLLTSPITLAVAAAAALTAAFVKWPGLFDQIVGGIKMFAGMFIESMTAILSAAQSVVGVFNNELAQSIGRAKDSMQAYADKLQLAGAKQIDLGTQTNETAKIVVKSVDEIKKEEKALDSSMEKISQKAAANKLLELSYAGVVMGTEKAIDQMRAETQERDKDLQRFTQYVEAKKRLSITKAQEEQLELAKVRSGAVGDSGGEESVKAKADYTIQIERQKQAELTALAKAGVITRAQLDEEVFESNQRIKQEELTAERAHQQSLADILGSGPAGFQAQADLRKKIFDQKLADDMANAERLGMNETQIEQMRQERVRVFQNQERETTRAHNEEMIQIETEAQRRKLEVLGQTPEAMEQQKQLETQAFQLRLQNRLIQAEEENATEAEIQSMKEQQELEHKARMTDVDVAYWNNQADLQQKSGNDWEAFLARKNAAIAQQGAVMGTLQAVQNSGYYKGEMQMLGDLSSLRNSKSRDQFEVGKGAAIAQATVSTFMGATQAFAAMSSIPIVGPVLGAIAAAAAIAAGMANISNIKSQQFHPQAHGGIDEIPQSLDNKTFLLSGGERVVQPEANKDLTNYLAKQSGDSGKQGATNYHITVNAGGLVSTTDTRVFAEAIVKEIRQMSQRGTPIISSKGIVDG